MQDNIILVGLMGAGKSTIGRQLARRFNLEFHDSDKTIEARTGVPIPTIFEMEGEQGFRDREEQVIAELSQLRGVVLATGGGSILRATNRAALTQAGRVVYLRASAEQLYNRIHHDKNRPLMQTDNPLQTLRNLLQAREAYYLEVADLIVPTGKQKVAYIVNLIAQKLNQLQDVTYANAQS
ncbi:MAG: shikimate kinase [Thiothrix sp.]|jgi:shikimate kinase|nr:MAG: shikimate kinase [Thiothrix sp.]